MCPEYCCPENALEQVGLARKKFKVLYSTFTGKSAAIARVCQRGSSIKFKIHKVAKAEARYLSLPDGCSGGEEEVDVLC